MRNSLLIFLITVIQASGSVFPQSSNLNLSVKNQTVREIFRQIENETDYRFFYNEEFRDLSRSLSFEASDYQIQEILDLMLANSEVTYKIIENDLVVITPNSNALQNEVRGTVTDSQTGETLPGISVFIQGTTTGTVTNTDGTYILPNVPEDAVLVFSCMGMKSREIPVEGRNEINVALEPDVIGIEEVIAIGYGTMRRSDLTGSVVRADIESFQESPNVSIMQSLQGSVPGLSVSQITQAGEESEMLIRGKSTLSGELSPLIVIDGVIFRGNLIDLNPNDIESIDILKDASSAAIYGSQATNGVVLITTTKSGGIDGKPSFNYSGSYSFQSPAKELRPPGIDGFYLQQEQSDIFQSRTAESGYMEVNPDWVITSTFSMSEEIDAFGDGRHTDWYSLLTNDNMYTQNHNLSLSNQTAYNNYLISIGYTEQDGYMKNEYYERINARINIDNTITDWMDIGVQSFFTRSDYSGQAISTSHRYIAPYSTSHDANGELIQIVQGNQVNPYLVDEADHNDKRLTLFGNVYADIDLPFVEGLSYRANLSNNYITRSNYYFRPYGSSFQGEGSKTEEINHDLSADNILSYNPKIGDSHNLDVTLVYGLEQRSFTSTRAISSVFASHDLGYNRLQAGSADLQQAVSGAWEEASLYSMARVFYGYESKYLLTGTIRRDGFSGFSSEYKFGLFPSLSFAWVASEESFLNDYDWLNQLKLRISYGSVGNRTIGRYSTLARVSGGFNYITIDGTPVFTQGISSLASPNLQWETTTGINLGVDFGISNRIFGSIDYYDNNTTNLLYEVDIPGISRFEKFPDNLGKIHNQGFEMSITSINLKRSDFEWSSTFNFTRNRNTLKELLGFDLDGDGKEDDLISEGLFIGESIDAIYDYKIDGKWQVGEDIPAGYDLGAHKVVSLTGEDVITPNDRTILGYRDPSYSFSINNTVRYNNWTLRLFINSIQGGSNYYLAEDTYSSWSTINSEMHFRRVFPDGLDFWTPENPDARYQRPDIQVDEGREGKLYSPRSFVRLQDVSLSYNVPASLMGRIRANNLRIYVSGKNLLTITDWNGWDPETGQTIDRGGRPVIKSYTFGVNFEF